MNQRVACYSEDDLQRVVARDYPPESRAEARAILDAYGTEEWHREPLRVRMACLRLADGDLAALRRHVEIASHDFRDVLTAAEYRRYRYGRPASEQSGAIEEDWAELQEWLHRR